MTAVRVELRESKIPLCLHLHLEAIAKQILPWRKTLLFHELGGLFGKRFVTYKIKQT